ncbi:MAG: hypothetical protein PHN31_03245, partial [Candidatus Gracilibacteria bacterium]|nr:hypothetical protein [Candidatus Gracilibacteria bacterium]
VSTNGGSTYGAYTSTVPDLSGDKTVKVRVKAQGGNPASADTIINFTENVVADITAPSKVSESFTDLLTINAPFSGTMTFDENIASVTSISISGDGSVQVDSGVGSKTLSISGVAPNNTDDVQITIVVEDSRGNSGTITSSVYHPM